MKINAPTSTYKRVLHKSKQFSIFILVLILNDSPLETNLFNYDFYFLRNKIGEVLKKTEKGFVRVKRLSIFALGFGAGAVKAEVL